MFIFVLQFIDRPDTTIPDIYVGLRRRTPRQPGRAAGRAPVGPLLVYVSFPTTGHDMMPEPISDAELDAILNRNRANGSVSMLRPMEIYLDREYLIAVTRQSLENLHANPRPETDDARTRKTADRALQQRIDFVAWLGQQAEQIHIALYPVSTDITDDDVMDILDDDQLWPLGEP